MQIKTLHYYKNYQYNATCKIKTLHYYKNYQYNATCKSKHYTTIKKTTNIVQHANQNITLL